MYIHIVIHTYVCIWIYTYVYIHVGVVAMYVRIVSISIYKVIVLLVDHQMLQAAANTAPRGVYVCGNTSTAAGLTVSVLLICTYIVV